MEAKQIMTAKDLENRQNWLDVRKTGIGGSDAAVLMGLSHWKTLPRLWMEKTGRVESFDISDSDVVYWGTVLEQVVADEFAKRTNFKLKKTGMYRSIRYPWMLASVDRMIIGERAGLECKTTMEYNRQAWGGEDYCGIPPAYYCQVQWYMAVLGYPVWYIACLIGGHTYIWKDIPRDDVFIGMLISRSEAFWKSWQDNVPPEPDSSSDYADMVRFESGYDPSGIIRLPKYLVEHVYKIEELKQKCSDVENEITYHQNVLKREMGANRIGYLPGYKIIFADQNRISKKTGQKVRTFKITRLEEEEDNELF